MPVVRLDDGVGTALVISHPTGITYVNQAGGTGCMQPGIEGALVPFGNDVALEGSALMSPQLALEAYFLGPKHMGVGATSGLDDADADAIDAILADARAGDWLKVNRARLCRNPLRIHGSLSYASVSAPIPNPPCSSG